MLSIISTTDEAEGVARQWMKRKYSGKIAKVKFNQVLLQDGVWTLKADVEMRTGVLSTAPRTLMLKIEADTTNVIGYSESPAPRSSPS